MTRYFCKNDCPCKADRKNCPKTIIDIYAALKQDGASIVTICSNRNQVGEKKTTLLSNIRCMEEKMVWYGMC